MNARQKRTARRLVLRVLAPVRDGVDLDDALSTLRTRQLNRGALLGAWSGWCAYFVVVEQVALKRPNSDTDETLMTGPRHMNVYPHGLPDYKDSELRIAVPVEPGTRVFVQLSVHHVPVPLNVTVVEQIDTFVPDVARLTRHHRQTQRCTDGEWNFASVIDVPATLTALYVDAQPAEPLTIGRWLDDTRPYATVRR